MYYVENCFRATFVEFSICLEPELIRPPELKDYIPNFKHFRIFIVEKEISGSDYAKPWVTSEDLKLGSHKEQLYSIGHSKDITSMGKNKIVLYADDTAITEQYQQPQITIQSLQEPQEVRMVHQLENRHQCRIARVLYFAEELKNTERYLFIGRGSGLKLQLTLTILRQFILQFITHPSFIWEIHSEDTEEYATTPKTTVATGEQRLIPLVQDNPSDNTCEDQSCI